MKITNIDLNSNNFDMLLFTEEEFKMVTGTDLSIRLDDDDDSSNKVKRFINDIGYIIKRIVMEYSFRDLVLYKDELYYNGVLINDEYIIKNIKLAAIEQAVYVLVNGDLSLRSGIGIERKMFNYRDKKKVTYSPRAKQLLMQAGLLGGNL